MRFFLVVAIWTIIVGGLWGYTSYRDAAVKNIVAAAPPDLTVSSYFTLLITPTFSIVEDPFALQVDTSSSSALEIMLNGEPLIFPADTFVRGTAVQLEKLEGVLAGHNEIYIKASPPISESSISHGVRLELFEGENQVLDKTIWGSGGALVSGTVNFSYSPAKEKDHEH